MNPNEQLIHTFYSAFQKKDYKTMRECYTGNATFNDPVFINLNARQAGTMWEMFCTKSKDLTIEFKNIKAGETTGSGEWTAAYTFSKTGKIVVNHIQSRFRFLNGKIVQHNDSFNFYKWASQALGLTGVLLGWTGFVKNKVRKAGMKSLNDFINQDRSPLKSVS